MKFCVVGGLQMVVLRFEFHQNRSSGFRDVGCQNLPIPIDLAIGLYCTTACTTVQAVMDTIAIQAHYHSFVT